MGQANDESGAEPWAARLQAVLAAPVLDRVQVHAAVCAYVNDALAAGEPVAAAVAGITAILRQAATRRDVDYPTLADRVVTWCIEEYFRAH